jgi:hypothetical protein
MRTGCSAMDTDEPEQEIVEAFTAFLEAPENARKEFKKLVRWLLEEKRKFLPNLGSSKEQDEEFNEEKKRLISLVIYLNKLTSQYNDISLKASFYDVAISAFIAGINLGQYSEPINLVKEELKSRHGSELSKKAAKKKAPEIATRKRLLENFCISKGLSLEELARSRNLCSTIAMDDKFISLCEAEGVKVVKEKRIQEYAADILKERHKK